MRDSNRITPLLNALGAYWDAHPSLTFGQLIVQLTGQDDPFYVEDDVIAAALSSCRPVAERDPDRAAFLCAVQAYWSAHPDLRLGQLAVILAGGQPPAEVDDHCFLRALAERLQ